MVIKIDKEIIEVLDDFRKMKIDYDIERFKLISYQLENLINNYETLIKTRKIVQENYFTTMQNIKENEIDTNMNYSRWEKIRSKENEEWKYELDEIYNLKYEIDNALELLKNGEIEKLLIEEEEIITGDKLH